MQVTVMRLAEFARTALSTARQVNTIVALPLAVVSAMTNGAGFYRLRADRARETSSARVPIRIECDRGLSPCRVYAHSAFNRPASEHHRRAAAGCG